MSRSVVAALVTVAVAIAAVAVYTRYVASSLGRVTSWWRTPWHNSEVGGNPGSTHIIGWAADVVPDGDGSMADVADAARAAGFPVVVNEGNHVHVSWFQS